MGLGVSGRGFRVWGLGIRGAIVKKAATLDAAHGVSGPKKTPARQIALIPKAKIKA